MLLLRNEGSLEIALTLHHIVAGLVRHLLSFLRCRDEAGNRVEEEAD
jgi:hypothetical protein